MGTFEMVAIGGGVLVVGGLIAYGLTRASTPNLPTYTSGPDQNASTNSIVNGLTQLGTAVYGAVSQAQAANRTAAATPNVGASAGGSAATPQNRSAEFDSSGHYYGTGTYNAAGWGR